MNMYQIFRKHQNGFFSFSADVLKFHKQITVEKNLHGLYVLKINDKFQASFPENQYEDAVIYFGNKITSNNLR